MSNIVNAAFHTIRSAQGIRPVGFRSVKAEENGVNFTVTKIPCIVTPFPSPWRHPIYWWKMRHLRADIRQMAAAEPSPLRDAVNKMEAEAFLRGTGEL